MPHHLCHRGAGPGNCSPMPYAVLLGLKVTYPHSPSQTFRCLLLPSAKPDHWGFLLQEMGTGNSKRDRSWGEGDEHSLVWGKAHFWAH